MARPTRQERLIFFRRIKRTLLLEVPLGSAQHIRDSPRPHLRTLGPADEPQGGPAVPRLKVRPPNLGLRFAGQRSRQLGRHDIVFGRRSPANDELQTITFRDDEPPSHLGIQIQEVTAIGGRKGQPVEAMAVDRSLDADLCLGAEELSGSRGQLDPKEVPEAADEKAATGQGAAGPVATCENGVRWPGADLSTQLVIRTD